MMRLNERFDRKELQFSESFQIVVFILVRTDCDYNTCRKESEPQFEEFEWRNFTLTSEGYTDFRFSSNLSASLLLKSELTYVHAA